jgi:hypothetical protein
VATLKNLKYKTCFDLFTTFLVTTLLNQITIKCYLSHAPNTTGVDLYNYKPLTNNAAWTCKFSDISGRNGPSPHPLIQQVPDVLNGIEIRALRWPWQNTGSPVLQEITLRTSSVTGGSCQDVPAGRVPHEGGGCLPCNAQR